MNFSIYIYTIMKLNIKIIIVIIFNFIIFLYCFKPCKTMKPYENFDSITPNIYVKKTNKI
jgi:hypothetical protein